jgi:hypothetical protein
MIKKLATKEEVMDLDELKAFINQIKMNRKM